MSDRHTHASGVETFRNDAKWLCIYCPACELETVACPLKDGTLQCWYCGATYALDEPLAVPREPQTAADYARPDLWDSDEDFERFISAMDADKAELAALRRDKARLDWLDATCGEQGIGCLEYEWQVLAFESGGLTPTVRAVCDRAMAAEAAAKEDGQ